MPFTSLSCTCVSSLIVLVKIPICEINNSKQISCELFNSKRTSDMVPLVKCSDVAQIKDANRLT